MNQAATMNEAQTAVTPATLKWHGWTDRGKVRVNNEDCFVGLQFNAHEVHRLGKYGDTSIQQMDLAFAVCDGMGGAMAGEFASQIATEKITTMLPRSFHQSASGMEAGFGDVLTELFAEIHRALAYVGSAYEECHGMETTLTLCWFTPGWMYFGHIGDSRVYYLPGQTGQIKQLSHDDTYVGWLYRTGQINEREARNHPRRTVLQKSLGGSNQFVEPQLGAVAYEPGDMFLMCTDGVVDGLHDAALLDLLRPTVCTNHKENLAQIVVKQAVENSGRDNTTAQVIQVL
jgi:serine/threonine protein phosphatase PrpC